MSEGIEIKLYNELPKFLFGNEKYLLMLGSITGINRFKNVTLFINQKAIATVKPFVTYNSVKQKACANVFQFLIELPSFKNEKFITLTLKIFYNQKEKHLEIAKIPIKKIVEKYEAEAAGMVAVCMPLYQPNLKLFKQQLQTIQRQSYQNIKVFIQDDCSDVNIYDEVKKYVDDFVNVYLVRNEENIGFYKNAELLLNKIGDSFEYVALSDQDDVWQPDKIEKQVNLLNKVSAGLCYTNLKIVDEAYNELQNSFWHNRSNHLKKPFVLNLRNVATGATMLFKQSILKEILPFPQQTNQSFHDHYICAQLQNTAKHKVVYLNETLSNYVQHKSNVTGFSEFNTSTFKDKFIGDIAFIKMLFQVLFKRKVESLDHSFKSSNIYYYGNFQRLKLFLLHQNKLRKQHFFGFGLMIKTMLQTFFLSYKMYVSKIKLNQFDTVIYKRIAIQLVLKLRFWLFKR